MKTLVLNAYPIDIHRFKDQAPGANAILGASVFFTEFLRALGRYGTYDRYYFLKSVADQTQPAMAAVTEERDSTWCLDSSNLSALGELRRAVLATPGPLQQELRLVRRRYSPRRDWPITGFIHSVNARVPPLLALALVLDEVRPWDVLICSSTAGRKVIEAYQEHLANTYPELGRLRQLPPAECLVIPLGTDPIEDDEERRHQTRQSLNLGADDVALLYVGRFAPTTKCDLLPLVAAFASLDPARRGRARLILAGDDTRFRMADGLAAAAATLGCADRVTVQPNPTHAQKQDLYRAADIFVSPSDNVQETFGLTLVEALSAGLPVIASDWNGYRDVIADGDTGFLVPTYWTDLGADFDDLSISSPVDYDGTLSGATIVDVQRLTACMELLIDDRERRRAMGRRARETFLARFNWPVIVRQYEALWDDLQARADREADSYDNSPNPIQGVIRRTFAHYPSAWLADECTITLGTLANRAEALADLTEQLPTPFVRGQRSLTRLIVEALGDARAMTIGELVTTVGEGATDLTARLMVARLLKHGVLRPAREG